MQRCAGSWSAIAAATAMIMVGCGSSSESEPLSAQDATTGAQATAADTTGGRKGSPSQALAMDECGLHTRYPGDEYCIAAPPPDKGFQLHIGPSNYDNPEPEYVLEPGQEVTSNFTATSGNKEPIYFYYRQFRMRPGAHHNIISGTGDSAGGMLVDMGHRIGTSNNLAEDSPRGGEPAPENQGVGIPLAANSQISVSLHSINTSEQPQLREIWVNFWYRDPKLVTEPVEELFAVGDPTFSVAPGEDTVLGPYRCNSTGAGRMLWFYGHRHANNVRFSAWRLRGDQRELFYESYHWEEPLLLEFASTVQNPKPDPATSTDGGWSGILDLQPGDQLEWECHVINKTDGTLHFTNNTYTGEMCIMDAELVGTNCRESFGRR